MDYHTINLERNRPTVQQATLQLSQELRLAKCNRQKALKIIHGYGSTGKGGAIKVAVLQMLEVKKRQGQIQHYVKGEDFTPFTQLGQQAIALYPKLKTDRDYGRQNDGITIVLF